MKSTLKVRGGVIPYGTVSLSGDSESAVFHLVQSFFNEKKVTLENIPRSSMVLDFINVLNRLGIVIAWDNETTLTVSIPSEISEDLASPDISYKFVQILIPAILFRKGSCTVPLTFRQEAKFYREIGFDIDPNNASILIRRNFIKNSDVDKKIKTEGESLYFTAARIFVSYFNPNISVLFNENDYRLRDIKEINSENRIKIPFNQFEFNLFASMASLMSAEVIIENYDLSESLKFLMLFDEIAGNYEVVGGKLKIWRHQKSLNDLYEFLTLSCDALGYLFLMLSLIAQKPVGIVCKNMDELSSIVTELNIMGCKISYLDGTDTVVVTVRPVNNLSAVKNEIIDPEWGGLLVFGAVASRGYSRITNFNSLTYKTEYLMDNLTNLNLDVSV